MIAKLTVGVLCVALSQLAFALDDSDVGTYATIQKDGSLSSNPLVLERTEAGWILRQQSLKDPKECLKCVMHESAAADVERFFNGPAPEGMSAECAHNSVMAFCRVVDAARPGRDYRLVSLLEAKPVNVQLSKSK
ncbi:hypothetical protein [Pelomonas sp. SE-A7]|uniref:hypothetical protein n=1 Tax=Pelomonas sp. SE-A7 TaxID=3054953 RepID=UPI00259CE647|nr:hypothetical protein [Pelomonas sp. SE-A7]MDM4768543.1 hypothetical protein [Pelomonas sp. SE-A7]